MRIRPIRWAAVVAVVLTLALSGASPAASNDLPQSWSSAGHDILGSRSQPFESTISTANVATLQPKWVFNTHGDVSATPTVSDGVIYFPDWGGYLNAVNAKTGALIWQTRVASFNGVAGEVSRTSPVIAGNELIIGSNDNANQAHPGAYIFAVNRATGALIWSTQVETHQAAIITGSAVVYHDSVFVGVSSEEENFSASPDYPCCTFRGSVVSLNVRTGAINWQYYTIPAALGRPCTTPKPSTGKPPTGCGYSGAAVWSIPAIDPTQNALYVGTGNDYTGTDAAAACEKQAQATGTSDDNCTDPADRFESVLSLDLRTGALRWSHKLSGYDVFNLYCIFLNPPVSWCPSIFSSDLDFGSGPNIFPMTVGGKPKLAVGIGQKSGVYWALDTATGAILWETLVGPGSAGGGIQFGTATDFRRIYVPIANALGTSYQPHGSDQTVTTGSWAALNPTTGAILWQTADPSNSPAIDYGPTSVANGVVYGGSLGATGNNMYALNAATGQILWRFPSGGSVVGAPAIVNGTVYWASGDNRDSANYGTTGNNKLYAFTLNGK